MSAFRANKLAENKSSQKFEESLYLQSDSPVMVEDMQVIQQSDYFTPQNFTSTIYNSTIAYPAPVSASKYYQVVASESPTQSLSIPIQIDGVTQKFNFLGIETTDPNEYEKKYGKELIDSNQIPFLDDINELNFNLPLGEKLAVDCVKNEFHLVGDLDALQLIDKSKINLNEYFLV
jgi:hypothetical protein